MTRIFHDSGFRIHFIVYVAVNLLLLTINLATRPDNLWFYWPLLGWGLGIIAHGYLVYRRTSPSDGRPEPQRQTVPSEPPRQTFP